MEAKFQKFSNALSTIFGTHDVSFAKIDEESYCVRSLETGMICGCELVKLIALAQKLNFHFYVRSNIRGSIDCVEFVIY